MWYGCPEKLPPLNEKTQAEQMTQPPFTTALEGTVAIEASGHVAGPYAGSLLSDLGHEQPYCVLHQ